LLAVCGVLGSSRIQADDKHDEFFEKRVRPVLIGQCSRCHGAKKQSSGLRVDSRESMLLGGDNGAALVPGDPAKSLLIQAVRREGDLKMPPKKKLTETEVAVLQRWIDLGAPWPKSFAPASDSIAEKAKHHWAFQPLRKPDVPAAEDSSWVRSPVDAFVLAKLDEAGLPPSPEADRHTLIRRLAQTLTGLPPSQEVVRLANDGEPNSIERVVDRLLESPHYGERWARHWLDVARYSDSKGYVYGREERFWVHAWTYRDWVVQALNDDFPYDRFLLLQLAADQVEDRKDGDLAAMGFLTLGRRFLGVKRDIIDDRIDVVCRGTMALTVGCARCHNHKYDPIPTADYYSLYGVFDSCAERLVPLPGDDGDDAWQKELQNRQGKLDAKHLASRTEWSNIARQRVADYLYAQTELHKYPARGFDQFFHKSDLLPAFVRRWEDYLHAAQRRGDPIFLAWHAYAAIPPKSFGKQASEVTRQLQQSTPATFHPVVAQAFREPPASMADVADRYGAVFKEIDARWKSMLGAKQSEPPTGFADEADEQLRRVLYGLGAPCEVPDEPIVHIESFFDTATCEALWKLQGEVDRWIRGRAQARYALTLVDRPIAAEPRVFRRGNSVDKGDDVPRQFLSLLAGTERKAFEHGSGRRELADAIIDPENPLTARVIVNRVWAHHFGQGLVPTPSDFGLRADRPSHPELLDWLASRFVAEGWSLKKLHRWIVLSSTFRQSSSGPKDPKLRARAIKEDPANRLLWRMNQRRMTFEQFRDAMLVATGELDRTIGGKPVDLFKDVATKRRTVYGIVDRQFFPSTLRMFDFANPDLHVPRRSETTVPQQALFFMNHPLVLRQVRSLAKFSESKATPEQRVQALFEKAYQRRPTSAELEESLALVRATAQAKTSARSTTAADWQYGYGAIDESAKRVTGFTPLPHFTGGAWQGSGNWPDAKLGWVQLTADGGHPGNDRQHAAIRRWTAPRKMSIEIRSQLIHDAAPGDGIRAFVVSSRSGLLQSTAVHKRTVELNVKAMTVEANTTIDFVVDIGDVLNNDQYLWEVKVSELNEAGGELTWNSKTDFPRDLVDGLSPWEQLAQVLLCTNEFLFVD
jgi:hypothetical protein